MNPSPLDSQTIYLMRETIRIRLAGDATVREAAAEARGIAFGREPGCDRKVIDQVVHDLLVEIDALLPDLAPVEFDGQQYRPADDREVAETLAFALGFDERGKPRRTGWQGLATKIAAGELAARLRLSNMLVFKGPPNPPHTAGEGPPAKQD